MALTEQRQRDTTRGEIIRLLGFATAAAHYGLTTPHRNTIFLATPARLRGRALGESRVRIISQAASKFFGFGPVDALGYTVMMSDREKTAIDCLDHPGLAGGVDEVAAIFAAASRRLDWTKAADYLERIDSGALVRRFGWLVDYVKADLPPEVRTRLLQLAGRSRKTWLGADPARAPSRGSHWLRPRVAGVRQCEGQRITGERGPGESQDRQEGRLRMFTRPHVQRYSTESGLRDVMIAEKEVVLTFLLQLLSERGLLERLAGRVLTLAPPSGELRLASPDLTSIHTTVSFG